MKRQRPQDSMISVPLQNENSTTTPTKEVSHLNFPLKRPRLHSFVPTSKQAASSDITPDTPPAFKTPYSSLPYNLVPQNSSTSKKRPRAEDMLVIEPSQNSLVPSTQNNEWNEIARKRVSLESDHPDKSGQVIDLATGQILDKQTEDIDDDQNKSAVSKSLVRHPHRLKMLPFGIQSAHPYISSLNSNYPTTWHFASQYYPTDSKQLVKYHPTEVHPSWTVEEPVHYNTYDGVVNEPNSSVIIEELDDDYDELNDPMNNNDTPITNSTHSAQMSNPPTHDSMDIDMGGAVPSTTT